MSLNNVNNVKAPPLVCVHTIPQNSPGYAGALLVGFDDCTKLVIHKRESYTSPNVLLAGSFPH